MTDKTIDQTIKILDLTREANKVLRKLCEKVRQGNNYKTTISDEEISENEKELKELKEAGLIIRERNEISITLDGQIKGMS